MRMRLLIFSAIFVFAAVGIYFFVQAPHVESALQNTATQIFSENLWYGKENDLVQRLQQTLTDLGYYDGPITGFYGVLTTQAVTRFQELFASEILYPEYQTGTGALGPRTRAKLNALLSSGHLAAKPPSGSAASVLSAGSRGGEVRRLQEQLTELGFYSGPITGYFGPLTRAAVIHFQEAYFNEILTPAGLSAPSGIAGSFTLAKLKELIAWHEAEEHGAKPVRAVLPEVEEEKIPKRPLAELLNELRAASTTQSALLSAKATTSREASLVARMALLTARTNDDAILMTEATANVSSEVTIAPENIFAADEAPKFTLNLAQVVGALGGGGGAEPSTSVNLNTIDRGKNASRWDGAGISVEAGIMRDGAPLDIAPEITEDAGSITLSMDARAYAPGRYTLWVAVSDGGQSQILLQDFTWGVVVVNTDQSVYAPGDTVHFSFGVLTDSGNTVCDAALTLEITSPAGAKTTLTTDNGGVVPSGQCGANNVVDVPDYRAEYRANEMGEYRMRVSATTQNGLREVEDRFAVVARLPFRIKRSGASRIYPPSPYRMTLEVTAESNFIGTFSEYVPKDFAITPSSEFLVIEHKDTNPVRILSASNGAKEIRWFLNMAQNDKRILSYEYDAPDISPEIFKLGKATLVPQGTTTPVFSEDRFWLLASDVVGTPSDAWWNYSWQNRRKITFDNSAQASNLVNFPVMVGLIATGPFANIVYTKTQDAGQDIRFIDQDNNTILPYEIEKWDETGTSTVWVKVGQIDASSATDNIWMYYNNVAAVDQQATTTVWDSDYKMVQHFAETTNGSTDFKDSTSNKYDSAAAVIGTSGESNAGAAGKMSGGIRLDGTDDYIQTESFTLGNNFTVSVWVNSDVADQGTYNRIAENLYSSHFYLGTDTTGTKYKLIVKNGVSPFGTAEGGTISAGGWQFVVGTYNGTTGLLYVDGAQVASGTFTAPGNVTDDIFIGKYSGGASNYWNGYVDELRVSNTTRSAQWIAAQYKSMYGNFNTYAAEEDIPVVVSRGGGSGTISATSGAAEETAGATNVGTPSDAWWNYSWQNRRKITFDNSAQASNLTNFPVMVGLTASGAFANIVYTKTQDAGQDIRFIDQDNNTILPYEIEKWDETGTSTVWVKVGQIDASSATDHIWMYYNNPGATDAQQATQVWDSNYKGVWHLRETSGNASDSTTNGNTATPAGGITQTAAGIIGNAYTFNGSTGVMTAADSTSLDISAQITLSAWVKTAATNDYSGILSKFQSNTGYQMSFHTGGGVRIDLGYGTNYLTATNTTMNVENNAWHYIVGVYNGSAAAIYVDGIAGSLMSSAITMSTNAVSLRFGQDDDAANRYFNGTMDEVQISSTARSAQWIAAQYKSMYGNFNTYAAEEDIPVVVSRGGGSGTISATSGAAEETAGATNVGGAPSTAWWNTSWTRRRKITFDNSAQASNLANFPVMVGLTSSTVDYAQTQDAGQDIRFLDQDNSTLLSYEIETWDETGTSTVWVKVGQIDASSATDNIWMYYGNSSAADSQAATSVWDSNYLAVWHMKEDPAGAAPQMKDSTTNAEHATSESSMASTDQVAGKMNYGTEFDGQASDFISSEANFPTSFTQVTTEAWFKNTITSGTQKILNRYLEGPSFIGFRTLVLYISTATPGAFMPTGGCCSITSLNSSVTVGTNAWHHLAATYDSSGNFIVYLDGVQTGSSAGGGALNNSATSLRFGAAYNTDNTTGTQFFNGVLDEIRISNTPRTAAWIAAQYKSMYGNFNTYAAEESQDQGGGASSGGDY